MKRRVCVITATRAEYGLLKPLLYEIRKHDALELQLLVSATHLAKEYGETYKEIEEDFVITSKIPILGEDASDPLYVAKAMSAAQIGFAKAFAELSPDIIVVLGDRYEIFCAVAAALIAKIPVAHLDGGEITQGAIDDALRHAITKMSHLHFTCHQSYAARVIQLGEEPSRVFNVGSTSVDAMRSVAIMPKEAFEESIGLRLGKKNLLITYHPTTLSTRSPKEEFAELLEALERLDETHLIFTKANADTGGAIINAMIEEFVAKHPQSSICRASLGQLRYLNAIYHCDAVVGNSSSGISEAPFYKRATINIGDRQKGRLRVASIIDVAPKSDAILEAIESIYAPEFQAVLKNVESPYGEGRSAERIASILLSCDLSDILQKSFYDLEF